MADTEITRLFALEAIAQTLRDIKLLKHLDRSI